MNRLVLIVATLPLVACNDPGFRGVSGVRTATEAEVARCVYVADITSTPSLYGPVIGTQALAYARNQALQLAKESGANTLVFAETAPGATVYELRGRAYRC